MREFLYVLLGAMFFICITNLITPALKCEKQIRFLSGMIFVNIFLGAIVDFCETDALKIPAVIIPETYDEYSSGAYSMVNEHIINNYRHSLCADIEKTLSEELGIKVSADVYVLEDPESEKYGNIEKIILSQISAEEFGGAKKIINSFYGVDAGHIHMNERGE